MKKILFLTKTLLCAILLCAGVTNARAGEATTIYERGTTNAWAASDVASGEWSAGTVTAGLSAAGGKLSQSGTNGGYSSSKAISPTSGYKVAMTAVATMGSASGRNGSYDYITIGGAELRVLGQDQKAQVFIDGVAQGGQVSATRNAAYTFNVLINQTTGDVTYSVSGGATIAEATTATSTAITNVIVGHYKAGKENYGTTLNLTNISVTEEEYSVPTANYTVHFVDNNSVTVKDDDVRSGEIGAAVGASTADKATFIADDNKYVYSSDGGGTTVTNDGLAEFTVTYTKYVSTAYTVKAQVSGSDLTTLASSTAYLDGSTKEYWSKYINVDDNWYVADEPTYGTAITTATTNVAFTATDAVDYFFECEDFSNVGHAVYAIRTDISDASNGKAVTPYLGIANGIKSNSTIGSGVYDITIKPNYWRSGATDFTFQYSTDGDAWTTIETVSFATSSNDEYVADDVIIPANSYLRLMATSDATPNHSLDYMVLKKTADVPATENIVVTDAGYATYVSNYNLDFTSATTKAYKVSVAEKGVATMTEVAKVPAKTPVLLFVAGGNGEGEAIPVTTDAVDAVTGNNLVAGTGAGVATTDGDYTNMILNNIDSKIGFYFANGQTVATNRAYLHIDSDLAPDAVGSARGMKLVFEGEVTGVNAVEAASEATLADGKYFENGQIVIVKNGKKYNAAGAQVK